MKTITLHIPDFVELEEKDIVMLIAARLYEQQKLSLGQAAALVGYSKRTFLELLGKYGVSAFNYPSSELQQDVSNA